MNLLKNTYLVCFFAFAFNALPEAYAKPIVLSCSHPELCKLSELIFTENNMRGNEFKTLVNIAGDPHEFEPSTLEIKNLINAEVLITGPNELNPWIKKVNYQRSKNANVKTLSPLLEKNDLHLYAHKGSLPSTEAVSHFWLYPKILCSLKDKLEKGLVLNKLLTLNGVKKNCLEEAIKVEDELKATLKELKYPLVLTHDALLPLLENLTDHSASVVAIKGSGHHQETTPQAVKSLYNALKAPKVIWVLEKGIRIPNNVLSKKRKDDVVIEIDTANSNGTQLFPILVELNTLLKAIKP